MSPIYELFTEESFIYALAKENVIDNQIFAIKIGTETEGSNIMFGGYDLTNNVHQNILSKFENSEDLEILLKDYVNWHDIQEPYYYWTLNL